MRNARLWAGLLGVEKTVVERVEFDEDKGVVVASVQPARGQRLRCGICLVRSSGYDRARVVGGGGPWIWAGSGPLWRVTRVGSCCATHGVVVAAVPSARHGAGHTVGFDQTVAWLATVCSKTAVTELIRVAWRAVGAVVARVWSDVEPDTDLLTGLHRIGIDDISYGKGPHITARRPGPVDQLGAQLPPAQLRQTPTTHRPTPSAHGLLAATRPNPASVCSRS